MRKAVLSLIFCLALTLLTTKNSYTATYYEVTQLTEGSSYGNITPQINDNAQVVWKNGGGYYAEIFFYNGSEIVQLTSNGWEDSAPQINNDGWVVWRGKEDGGSDTDIYLFDGTNTINISHNDVGSNPNDSTPQINNNGWVVWKGTGEIYFTDSPGVSITQLTDGPYLQMYPQISDAGHIVWQGKDAQGDYEIFLYEAGGIIQITDNLVDDVDPQVNNDGCVVWRSGESDSERKIMLYDSGGITQVSDESCYGNIYPQINNNGWITWQGKETGGPNLYQIFLYDCRNIKHITKDLPRDSYQNPQINDRNQLTWRRIHGEAYVYDGMDVLALFSEFSSGWPESPQINNSGYVVFPDAVDGEAEILLAKPVLHLQPSIKRKIIDLSALPFKLIKIDGALKRETLSLDAIAADSSDNIIIEMTKLPRWLKTKITDACNPAEVIFYTDILMGAEGHLLNSDQIAPQGIKKAALAITAYIEDNPSKSVSIEFIFKHSRGLVDSLTR